MNTGTCQVKVIMFVSSIMHALILLRGRGGRRRPKKGQVQEEITGFWRTYTRDGGSLREGLRWGNKETGRDGGREVLMKEEGTGGAVSH